MLRDIKKIKQGQILKKVINFNKLNKGEKFYLIDFCHNKKRAKRHDGIIKSGLSILSAYRYYLYNNIGTKFELVDKREEQINNALSMYGYDIINEYNFIYYYNELFHFDDFKRLYPELYIKEFLLYNIYLGTAFKTMEEGTDHIKWEKDMIQNYFYKK